MHLFKNLLFGTVLVVAIFLSVPTLLAQEKTGYGQDDTLRPHPEQVIPADQENDRVLPATINNQPTVVKEQPAPSKDASVIVKPGLNANQKQPEAAPKKEEETLSYNVLYLIIQKFKAADMIN